MVVSNGNDILKIRRKRLGQLIERGFGVAVHLQRVGIAQLLNADADGVLAVVAQIGRVGFRAQLRVANIFELNNTGGSVLNNDIVELRRIGETSDHAHGNLIRLLRIGGRLAHLAGGNLDVLLRREHWSRPRR